MRHLNKIFFGASLKLLVMWSVAHTSYADPGTQLAERLNGIAALQADFTQRTRDRYGEVVNLSVGQLVVGANGKFNVRTDSPFEQHLVSNGEDFYTFDPDLEQVIVRPLVRDVSQVPILLLGNADPDFLKRYDVTRRVNDSETEFALTSTDNGVFSRLNMVFAGQLPSEIWLEDSLGQTTEIQLSQVVLNEPSLDKVFQFTVPDGVDLIDDR